MFCVGPVTTFAIPFYSWKFGAMTILGEIDWDRTAANIGNWSQLFYAVATAALAGAGYLGIKEWRKERYHKVGVNLIAALIDWQLAIRTLRVNIHQNPDKRDELINRVFDKAGGKLQKQFQIAYAMWGGDSKELPRITGPIAARLANKLRRYAKINDDRTKGPITDESTKKIIMEVVTLEILDEDTNEFSEQINSAVKTVEDYVRNKMK